jgi:lipoprotein-anchoring transpeptidase ErfK/SrfK
MSPHALPEPQTSPLSRRNFMQLGALASLGMLTSCMSMPEVAITPPVNPWKNPLYDTIYGPKPDEPFPLPAIPYEKIDPRYLRQEVADPTGERPGTLVVDTVERFVYLVREDGMAMRYGVGIGRDGFAWSGRAIIQWKRKWPTWTPPEEMIVRQPELQQYSAAHGGMQPGLMNPLGARALYIFQNGQDTLYRLHGNPDYTSIGKAVSSGCVRLINQDICDLYDRVPAKTPILVV